ncbi:MAG: hypothetical protein NTY85_01005, partial [Actinobacteria bacterium]|nr:hypothetical protein [Actinomycetota bacterium]
GNTSLTLTPRSSFTNGSPGTHYLNSITVSNIPDSCFGVDFTISAYDDTSSTPLALFNLTSKSVVVNDNDGTFERGFGSTGMTVASSTGTFTATFTTPVAQSTNVFKLTIQSGAHTLYDYTPPYDAGNTGPGSGFVFYVDVAGFNCGATYTSTGSPKGGLCHYLEVAPYGWSTGADTRTAWSVVVEDISGITNNATVYNNASGIGLGYKNSVAIVASNGAYNASSNSYAAGAARAYTGGSKSDWYLPTSAELNLLCQWVRGIPSDVTTVCPIGILNSATYGAQSVSLLPLVYWSSSENTVDRAWRQNLNSGGQVGDPKGSPPAYVRAIRAF